MKQRVYTKDISGELFLYVKPYARDSVDNGLFVRFGYGRGAYGDDRRNNVFVFFALPSDRREPRG